MTGDRAAVERAGVAHAQLALRVAWLREHGWRMFAVDPSGQLSAALWDHADLLEALDVEGRWDR